ncbi:retrovirus-related pol polyprotein from transposon TNT 1-94 [Tanacetum coccineum]
MLNVINLWHSLLSRSSSQLPRLQDVDDIEGDDLLYYDAEMELTNMILLSIPNEIYNSVDSCKTAKEMWARVERLMRGTIQNQVDMETRFTNEFDQFVGEPGESLVSVYNCFAQLMNDLERNNMKFPTVSINTKFLNSLQPEWLKYVTQVRLAKKLIVDSFDDLFDYLSQFEKLVNASRSKKLEKSHDPLALVAHTGSSSRNTSSYYVTHPSSVVDYDEENQAVVQGDRVNIQSRNSGNVGRNNQRAYVQGEVVEGMNATNETANVQRIVRTLTPSNTSTGQCYNCGGKGHYARNCPKPRVRDSKYFMEQMLLAKQDEAGVILSDEQNDFLFVDASRMEEIEELSAKHCLMAELTNAYDEAAKQQRVAHKVQQQNENLISQIEMYKERNRALENITKDNNYLKEFLEADEKAKRFQKQADSQLYHDREIIRNLEKQRDELSQEVKHFKQKNEESQQSQLILKRKISENEDKYHDTILDLEEKLKKNVDMFLKIGNSLQAIQAISECKVICASREGNNRISFDCLASEENSRGGFQNFHNLFQRDIKEMKEAFEQHDVYLDEIERQNDLIQKLEDENVSLDFKVQSLIKERDNAKMEYKKLFDSIKKTRSQNQKEMDELITHVSEKTYAYGAIRAENQNLLVTISELKARMKNGENGKSVNTKFDKTHGSQKFLCVTPLNKNAFQKQTVVLKTKENHVESKPVTSQTSHTKQTGTHQNTNVVSPGMYRVVTQQESQTNKSKNVVQIVLWVVDSFCSKHMTGDRSLLRNFVEKFMGTVRFGNDNFATITGYGDYIHGNITICHVYYVEGLGHNLFSVGQFFDGDLEVAFRSNTCYV